MAGDWIAFEVATLEKPEVYKLARMLGVSKADAILLLLTFWAWIDRITEDGIANALVTLDVDNMLRCPGFAKAMEAVGWLKLDDVNEQIMIPGFDVHHGKSAKKRLLTARRVANHKRSGNAEGNAKGNAKGNAVSVTNALPTEQNRTDIKPKAREESFALPDWVPVDAWNDFDQMRRLMKNGKTWTNRAKELCLAELQKLRASGDDPGDVLRRSVARGWAGVFPVDRRQADRGTDAQRKFV